MKILNSKIYQSPQIDNKNKYNSNNNFLGRQSCMGMQYLAQNNVIEQIMVNSNFRQTDINKRPVLTGENFVKIVSSENLLGEGNAHRVYSIENYPNFVLRVPKDSRVNKNSIYFYKPIMPNLPKYNFGDAICDLGQGVQVLNKVEGEPNSFPSWINYMRKTIYYSEPIEQSDAEKVLNTFSKIAEFPDDAYIDLAEKLKYLNDTEYTLDFLNPNNILVDFKNKKFNIIDLWQNGKYGVDGISGYEHMALMLCDGILHKDIINALSPQQEEQFNNVVLKIIDKCKLASKSVQLPSSEYEIIKVFKFLDKLFKSKNGIDLNYFERYKTFKERYNV